MQSKEVTPSSPAPILYTSVEAILAGYFRTKRKAVDMPTGVLADKLRVKYDEMRAIESGKMRHSEFDIRVITKLAGFYGLTFNEVIQESVEFGKIIEGMGVNIGFPVWALVTPRFVDAQTLSDMYRHKMGSGKSTTH
jgi:hypothetical protein